MLIKQKNDFVFAEQAWKFSTEAPVRSNVVFNHNMIFSAQVMEYFMHWIKDQEKKNGNIILACDRFITCLLQWKSFFSDNKQSLNSLNAKTGTPRYR